MKSAPAPRRADVLEVLKLFRAVFGSQKRHHNEAEQASGLGGAQMWALSEIRRRPGITVGELARLLAIHRSTATNLVNRLETLKLVAKYREGGDQRKVLLEATARGSAICGKTPKPSVLQRALLDMPPATLRTLNRDLSRLVNSMDRRGARTRRAAG